MERLAKKYADRDVQFAVVYVREPHPGERAFRRYAKHASLDHKVRYAQELVRLKAMEIPVVVDGLDEAAHRVLGNLPNLAYVVDKEGRVVFKSTWTNAEHIDEVLAELTSDGDPGRRLPVTIRDADVGMAI
ncbi:MAG: hypothetical protein HY614_01970 [Candidatus Rokubacteria bacterium]|nr:hypothetical protein [Candidatus Rokubacteria bacterium]